MEEQPTVLAKEHDGSFSFTTDVGRLFELGFNTGFLTAIQQRKAIESHFGDLYQKDLSRLRFPALMAKMYERTSVISTWDKETLERWSLFFLQKGFLAGLNFFEEYLQSFDHIKPIWPREIVYLQCNFYGANSLDTYPKDEQTAVQELMAQFHAQGHPVQLTEQEMQEYSSKGNFLRADTLMLLRYGKQWRILCVDLSVFSLHSLQDASDLASIEKIRSILATELRYVRSKSAFTNLSIDTDIKTASEEILAGQLKHYFTAFKRQDKESVKLIQAASYAYSFYGFLKKQGILTEDDKVSFNVVGYTDRNINAMSVKKEHIELLSTCADIYKSRHADQTIADARSYVLETIQKAAAKSFGNGKEFVSNLVHLLDSGDGLHWLEHEETLDGFVNTRSPLAPEQLSPLVRERLERRDYQDQHILDVHGALIRKELASRTPYLFLTGSPGIGKTTAIVNFLKARAMQGEGFLFLYVSPRKQVNLDIINKFKQEQFGLHCENLFAMTANSVIIRNNSARPTVHYYSKKRQDTFLEHGVKFIFDESDEAKKQRKSQRRLEEIQEGLLIDRGERISGVLSSLCNALYAALDKPLSNAIVATVAIQSLKRTGDGSNTLRHLERIFEGAYSKETGVIPDQMRKISSNIKHFFVMIDEVTGDESGAEFLDGIHNFLHRYELINSPYGINTKVIVADASILDPQVIQQHLSDTAYEPDKIYFRRVSPQQGFSPLSILPFTFKKQDPAVVINANAYPARKLHVTYKIGVDAFQFSDDRFVELSKQLDNSVQQHIIQDILKVLDQKDAPQLLVYIQDKQRLALLIQAIQKLRNGAFQPGKDYLEIHANISEADKKEIEEFQEIARVVFMTASASRGLSFKRAKHILVDIPHFEIEQNLMEILQVIYRGRGGDFDQDDKTLTFYLCDRVVYSDSTDRELSVRESMLHLLNVLLILKTSIMTRIEGSGRIGLNQRFMMIPIGGKSVFAAGDTFTSRISKLIKELRSLSHRFYDDKRLEYVYTCLTRILDDAVIRLISAKPAKHDNDNLVRRSYLRLIPTFSEAFVDAAQKGFDQLLLQPPMERGYVSGGLLIVPIINKSMQEKYWMKIEEVFGQKDKDRDLLASMHGLSYDPRYHESMQMAMKDAIALIQLLKEMAEGKIPHYEQESNHKDQHYALPLMTFLANGVMKAYFKSEREREEDSGMPFHSLLISYIRALCPADSILPIGSSYEEFPFIVFRSLNLGEARRKMFTDKYLFMSHEFNILNMLLSRGE